MLPQSLVQPRAPRTRASTGAASALLVVLAAVFLGIGDRDHIGLGRVEQPAKNLALAANLSADKLALFKDMRRTPDGRIDHRAYNRFPIGGMLLIKLVIAPFEGDLSAQILSARVLMLAFFCAAALTAYLALCRLVRGRAVPFAATLLAFSSYPMLDVSDLITTECGVDLFGVLLVFHGLVVFAQEGRFGQLAAKTCVALLLGWHVYALLAPFLALALAGELVDIGRRQARVSRLQYRNEPARRGLFDFPVWRRGLRLLRTLAAQTARSSHTRLGLVALLAGAIVLGYNFRVEYTLLGGETPFAELPSVRSALARSGVQGNWAARYAQSASFLPWQFHRVGVMLLPGLSSPGEHAWRETAWRMSGAPPLVGVGVLATVACFGALLFAPAFRGRRALWAALALSGFCWALPMRHSTAVPGHDFETIHFVGIPLILCTALLLGAREIAAFLAGRLGADRTRWRERVATGCAVLGAAVFATSSVRMDAVGRDADKAARARAVMGEFERIRDITRGKDVLLMRHHDKDTVIDRSIGITFSYYMAGSVLHWPRTAAEAHRLEAGGEVDYVLGLRYACSTKPDADAIGATATECTPTGNAAEVHALTPTHRFAFLYAPGGVVQVITDGWRRDHQAALLAGELPACGTSRAFPVEINVLRHAHARTRTLAPSARGTFDVHVHGGALIYTREPCSEADVAAQFFVHVAAPAEVLPEHRRAIGFDNRDFGFHDRGAIFDGKCVAKVPLPNYAIRNITTGQFASHGTLWSTRIDMTDQAQAKVE